ncbi:hypothetical protein HFP72_24985 [Nocardiopsis sp. ARC36]
MGEHGHQRAVVTPLGGRLRLAVGCLRPGVLRLLGMSVGLRVLRVVGLGGVPLRAAGRSAVGLLGLCLVGVPVGLLCLLTVVLVALVGLRGVGGLAAGRLSVAGVGLLSVRGLGPEGCPYAGPP